MYLMALHDSATLISPVCINLAYYSTISNYLIAIFFPYILFLNLYYQCINIFEGCIIGIYKGGGVIGAFRE